MKKALMIILAALVLTLVGAMYPAPADAGTSLTSTTDLIATSLQATETGGLAPIMKLPATHYEAGERVLVTSRLAGRSSVDKYPRMALRVDATGAATVRSPVISRNHSGSSAGTQYLTVRWLFIAPTAGTYTITARAEATSYYKTTTARLLVVSGTYLKLSTVNQKSTTWGPASDACVSGKAHPSPDYTACRTVQKSKDVLVYNVRTRGYDTITAGSDLELSCEYGSYPGGTSKVSVTIYAKGINAAGKVCTPTKSVTKTISITSLTHHWHDNSTLAGMDVSCAATVALRTRVTYLSGNPVAIHDKAQSNGFALLS